MYVHQIHNNQTEDDSEDKSNTAGCLNAIIARKFLKHEQPHVLMQKVEVRKNNRQTATFETLKNVMVDNYKAEFQSLFYDCLNKLKNEQIDNGLDDKELIDITQVLRKK